MPARPYRLAELHQHAVRQAAGKSNDHRRALFLARRNGWPMCAAGCGWPVNPAAGTTHPTCDQPPSREDQS